MPPNPQQPSSAQSDGELLRVLAAEPHESARAQSAWNEFYARHVAYLYKVCYRSHARRIGQARVEEVVQDTFLRAREKAATYVESESLDEDGRRRQVRAWLGKIANSVVVDSFRREPQIVFVDDSELRDFRAREPDDEELPSQRLLSLEKALEELTEREQDVLRATAQWYVPGQKQQRMPNSEMKKLATALQTSPANIRQIRLRAMKKLEDAMSRREGTESS